MKFFTRICRVLLTLASLTFLSTNLYAQRDDQLWFDFQVDYPFANQYLAEVTSSYQTIFSPDEKWRNLSITPTFEYSAFTRFDFLFNVPMAYTLQTSGVNSYEVSPSLGVRFHISQNKRVDTRLIYKFEERFFYQTENNDWSTSTRNRIKAEARICINKPNLSTDNLWYVIFDYEEFIVLDQQLEERYANRRRARLGLGYRLDYRNRFELIYTRQSSRNEIEGDFNGGDNIFQIRYKLFLNPARKINSGE